MDGLRGIACLMVLVFHAWAEYQPDLLWLLSGSARIGVWLFFVLSAFLLTLKLLKQGFSKETLVQYTVDRFLRIIPLFVVATVLYHLLGMIEINTWQNVWEVLTFQRGGGHLWTVPPELKFYVVLPTLVFSAALLNKHVGSVGALSLIVASMVIVGLIWPPHIIVFALDLKYFYLCFAFGVLAAFAVHLLPRPSDKFASLISAASLVCLVVFIWVWKSGIFVDPLIGITDKHVEISAIWALFSYSIYGRSTIWARALSYKPLADFGLVIYSTYLFHWMFMEWIARLDHWWAIPLSITASIIAGIAGYILLEKPLHRLRRPVGSYLTRLTFRRLTPIELQYRSEPQLDPQQPK